MKVNERAYIHSYLVALTELIITNDQSIQREIT